MSERAGRQASSARQGGVEHLRSDRGHRGILRGATVRRRAGAHRAALDGWRLAVVDPASGQPVRWGEAGELVIGGAGVARYLDSEKDAVGFRPLEALSWERAFRSGDLVRADPEGLVFARDAVRVDAG